MHSIVPNSTILSENYIARAFEWMTERRLPAMDLLGWLVVVAFEGAIVILASLLALAYISFNRMEKDVRRARMFIMGDRVNRFLGAFTIGFIVLAATFAATVLALIPAAAFSAAFFFFLGTIGYGVMELYFIVRPRRKLTDSRAASWGSADGGRRVAKGSSTNPVEEEVDASR